MFYLPHYLWKMWENGVISSICKRLHENKFACNEYLDANYDVIYYLQSCFKLKKSLVYKYYFCHLLLLANLVAQVVALDYMFNDQFLTYGYDVFRYLTSNKALYNIHSASEPKLDLLSSKSSLSTYNRRKSTHINMNNPLDYVFPKVTSCQVEIGSEAAGVNVDHYICVLPLNILNDKFFLLLWCWFAILAALTVLQVFKNIMFLLFPLKRRHTFVKNHDINCNRNSTLAEIFILNLIGQNSDKIAFSALVNKLYSI